jgi:hypothetical protein
MKWRIQNMKKNIAIIVLAVLFALSLIVNALTIGYIKDDWEDLDFIAKQCPSANKDIDSLRNSCLITSKKYELHKR